MDVSADALDIAAPSPLPPSTLCCEPLRRPPPPSRGSVAVDAVRRRGRAHWSSRSPQPPTPMGALPHARSLAPLIARCLPQLLALAAPRACPRCGARGRPVRLAVGAAPHPTPPPACWPRPDPAPTPAMACVPLHVGPAPKRLRKLNE